MGREPRKRGKQRPPQEPSTPDDAPPRATDDARVIRRQHLWLWGVFALALLLRVSYLWGQYQENPFFNYPPMDEGAHHAWAQQIAGGEGMGDRPYIRAPLYYYLLGLLYAVAGPKIWLARLVGCVLGALNCYLIGRLGRTLGGIRVGLVAGVLAALYWPAIYFDAELLTVGLEITLNVSLLWALVVAGRRDNVGGYVLAGVLWGLAAITRPTVLAFAPIIWLWSWLSSSRDASVIRRLRGAALATGLAGLVIMPVTLRNLIVAKEFVPIASSAGINLYIGNNPESTGYLAHVPGVRPTWEFWMEDIRRMAEEAEGRELSDREVSSHWAGRAFEWIRSEPGAWLKHMGHKLALFWTPLEIPNNQSIWFLARRSTISAVFWLGFPVVAVLAIPGLVFVGRGSRDWLVPALFVLMHMAVIVTFFCPARFRMPIVPVLIVAAAVGLVGLLDWYRQKRFALVGGYVGLGVVVAGIIALCPPSRAEFRAKSEVEGHYSLGRLYATPAPDGPEDLTRAAEEFSEAVRLDPDTTYRRRDLADVLFASKDYGTAATEFARIVADQPRDFDSRMRLGACLMELGQPREAIEHYRVVLDHNSRDAAANRQMGDALVAIGDHKYAAYHFRVAAEADPEISTRYNLATTLLRANQVTEATEILEQILSEDPGNAHAAQNLGVAYARQGDLERAAIAFGRAAQADATLIEAHVNQAHALWKQGKYSEQKWVLERALHATSANPQIAQALAWMLATSPDETVRDAERAATLAERLNKQTGGKSARVLDILAAAHAADERYDEAVRIGEQALLAARQAGQPTQIRQIEARLSLYRQRRPFVDSRP